MALEVDMHDEITRYRAKVFLGMSFRQLGAVGAGLVIAGGAAFAVSYWTAKSHQWADVLDAFSTGYGSIVFFGLMLPFAFIGWARPYGLKPEVFARFFIRHFVGKKVLTYGDKEYPLTARRSEVKRYERGKVGKVKTGVRSRRKARKEKGRAARAA